MKASTNSGENVAERLSPPLSTRIKRKFGWQLEKQRAEFFAQSANLLDEAEHAGAGLLELTLVRDRTRHLYAEAKRFRHTRGPTKIGLFLMRPVERRIDLNAWKNARIAFQVRAFPRKGPRVL